jgi:hypothetical protein
VTSAVVVVFAGLTVWAAVERGRAEQSAAAAAEQRDKAVLTRSLLLADLGRQRNEASDFGTGMALAVEALSDPYAERTTDSPEAERVLRQALWNLREAHSLELGPKAAVNVLLFSPDGSRLLVGSSDGVARLWDVETGRLIKAMVGHSAGVRSAVFSADGLIVATGDDDGGLRVWRGDTGDLLRTLRAHEDMVTSLEFSRDGKRLLSASWDQTARVDDPAGIEREVTFRGHTHHVWAARFSPDERTVVTAAEDGLRFFTATEGNLIREMRNNLGLMSVGYLPAGDSVVFADRWGTIWTPPAAIPATSVPSCGWPARIASPSRRTAAVLRRVRKAVSRYSKQRPAQLLRRHVASTFNPLSMSGSPPTASTYSARPRTARHDSIRPLTERTSRYSAVTVTSSRP